MDDFRFFLKFSLFLFVVASIITIGMCLLPGFNRENIAIAYVVALSLAEIINLMMLFIHKPLMRWMMN